MSHRLTIRLSNLYLDLQNPRYEKQKSQNEALNTIAREQGSKLLVLLKDIIENGLNPSDIPIVMPDPSKDNGYIVLEGNRRIAALKLFKKPTILVNATQKQKYRKLHDNYKKAVPQTIECLVVNSREEANLWIERKHEGEMNGAGTVRWDSVQKGRFMANKTGKDSKVVQLIDFMKVASEGDTQFVEGLKKVGSTNLDRMLGTPEVRSSLGLEYTHGEYSSRYEWREVLKGLKAIVKRMSEDDFKVADIYHKADRLRFIADIPMEELPDKTKKAEQPWKLREYTFSGGQKPDDVEDETKGEEMTAEDAQRVTESAQQERPTSRTMFLPEDLTLSIPSDRCNRIYTELKQMSHITLPNACSVLMRVFLELSVDCYIETFSLLKNGAVSAAKGYGDLKHKANEVIHHLCNKKYLDDAKAKGIRTEINKDQSMFSIDTMNAYVHNVEFNPIPDVLMLSWDNIQPFMIALWKAVSEKE